MKSDSYGHGPVEYSSVYAALFSYLKLVWSRSRKIVLVGAHYCIPDAKRGYYGFIIVVVRALVRVRRDILLATYSPHFFPDFFHIWQVA